MKLRIVVEIDPPSAERCVDDRHGEQCPFIGGVFIKPSPWFCQAFRRETTQGARLPECIAAEQQHRAMAGGIIGAVEEIARGLTTTGHLPAPPVDRVATDPVIALCQDAADRARAAQGG